MRAVPVAEGAIPFSRDEMPRWVPRSIVMLLGGVVVLYVARWLLAELRGLIVMILVSLFLSFAIEPAVNWLHRKGMRRGAATMFVFVVIAAAIAVFVAAMGSLLADQISRLIDEAPGYIEQTQEWLEDRGLTVNTDDILATFQEGGAASRLAQDLALNLVDFSATLLNVLFQLLTISLFTFYLVADGPRFRRVVCSTLTERRQREVLFVWDLAISKTGGYIYSRALLSLVSFIFHWIAFAIIGVPFPLALALWVGVVSQFVPVIGTYIAGVFPLLIALFDRPVSAISVLVVIVVYQQVENYLFAPRITAQTLEIHPAMAFGSVLAGSAILGPVGALLALPAAATSQAFVSTYVQRHSLIASDLLDDMGHVQRPEKPLGDSMTPLRDDVERPVVDGESDHSGDDPGTT